MTLLLLLATSGARAELPWSCPAIAAPEDAYALRTDGGLPDAFDALETEARTWWDDGCAWTSTANADGSVEEACTTDAGAAITYRSYDWEGTGDSPTTSVRITEWSLEVTLPEGVDGWSAITLSYAWSVSSDSSWSSHTGALEASWSGAMDGLPDDAWFTYEESASGGTRIPSLDRYTVTTPGCAWIWQDSRGEDGLQAFVSAPDHLVQVVTDYYTCGASRFYANVDGALYGAIDSAGWALDEGDRDGWTVAAGDCDDADATTYPCATESAVGDGWDQDCDGTDDTDDDGDGWLAGAVGGEDCDDASAAVNPDAADPAGDGIDQNCDGADEVDADGDGYTVDGDDGEADCDDTTLAVSPARRDASCDGVDQDCSGADNCSGDTGDTAAADTAGDTAPAETGADTAAPAAPPAPAADAGGCRTGGSAGLLFLFLPVAGRRRGRR